MNLLGTVTKTYNVTLAVTDLKFPRRITFVCPHTQLFGDLVLNVVCYYCGYV